MVVANIHRAKTELSKLIERAEAGEEVVIARNGTPVVRLTPVRAKVPASPEEILKGFEDLNARIRKKRPEGWDGLDEILADKHLDGAWENGFITDQEHRSWADRLQRFDVWPADVEAFIAQRLPPR